MRSLSCQGAADFLSVSAPMMGRDPLKRRTAALTLNQIQEIRRATAVLRIATKWMKSCRRVEEDHKAPEAATQGIGNWLRPDGAGDSITPPGLSRTFAC